MLYDEMNFKKFSVNPQKIIDSHHRYDRPWSPDWFIETYPNGDMHSINVWCSNNMAGEMKMTRHHSGTMIVAFSDESDAIMFKISYQGNEGVNIEYV